MILKMLLGRVAGALNKLSKEEGRDSPVGFWLKPKLLYGSVKNGGKKSPMIKTVYILSEHLFNADCHVAYLGLDSTDGAFIY